MVIGGCAGCMTGGSANDFEVGVGGVKGALADVCVGVEGCARTGDCVNCAIGVSARCNSSFCESVSIFSSLILTANVDVVSSDVTVAAAVSAGCATDAVCLAVSSSSFSSVISVFTDNSGELDADDLRKSVGKS